MNNHTSGTITIQLTRGQVTVIDAIDADLAEFKWCAYKAETGAYYAVRTIADPDWKHQKTIYLHRAILERKLGRLLQPGEKCDHHNRDTLDNTRGNLRLASNAENMRNTKRYNTNTSGYKGVCWFKRDNKWKAQIKVNGKNMYLGLFVDIKAAARAYNDAAVKHYGEFARLNEIHEGIDND